MYHVSAQGVDERMIIVHYYYYYYPKDLIPLTAEGCAQGRAASPSQLCQRAKILLSSWSVVCCVSRPSQFLLSSWSVVCCVSGPSFCSLLGLLYLESAGQDSALILVCCMLCQWAKFLLSSWSVVCCVSGPSLCSLPGLLYVAGVAFADSLLWKHRVQSWRHQTAEVCD